jgi:hypothetical protein
MLERQPNVDRCQAIQVIRTKVSRPASISIILGRTQAIIEVGEHTPGELASLLNSALRKSPFNEPGGLRRLVVVVTG